MKTITLLALSASTLWLLGCTGLPLPTDMRERTTPTELTSSRSAKEVAVCIADAWESKLPSTSMRSTQGGYSMNIQHSVNAWSFILADVIDAPNGSKTTLYKGVLHWDSFEKDVKECQQ